MSINRIQKLLFSEYCDFQDMVLVESPFAETTREGLGLRQVHIGLTPSKLVLATDILPRAEECPTEYLPGVDPEIETLELIAVYPIDCVNLSIFHKRKRQSLKARFCNNKVLYFELGGFERRNMFWNLWCEKVKFLSPEDPNFSHSETSVATSTTNSTLYLVSSRHYVDKGKPQIWCQFGAGDFPRANAKWTDKHLYLGKLMEESPLKYTPCQFPPREADFIKRPHSLNKNIDQINSTTVSSNSFTQINRFSSGVAENCSTALFLPADESIFRKNISPSTQSIDVFTMYQTIHENLESFSELAENSVRLWEFHKVTSSSLSTRGRHRRRYAFAPHPHFYHGLGPWNVEKGDRYTLQIKRAVSCVRIKRQPVEPELRLSISRRQLLASISCENLQHSFGITCNNLRNIPRSSMIYFWTPEYWYRPRSAKDAYQELRKHLQKIHQYHNIKDTFRSKIFKYYSYNKDQDLESETSWRTPKKRKCLRKLSGLNNCLEGQSEKETSIQFLKRMLRLEVSLSAWDFDSNTMAQQLTLIDRDLFLRITAAELCVLSWQKSAKNAPNVGALIAFSHRIGCLVATEILKDDSEKIRARLAARFISIAEKCHNFSNFQSCRSILCGLQSPPVYRLYSMWNLVRKRHSSRYCTFEKLCRLYRDPRLPSYQAVFAEASKQKPYIPFIGDLLCKLLNKVEDSRGIINANSSESTVIDSLKLGIKISVKPNLKESVTSNSSRKNQEVHSFIRKLLSSLKVWHNESKATFGHSSSDESNEGNQIKKKSPGIVVKVKDKKVEISVSDSDLLDDGKVTSLKSCIDLLENYQRAAKLYRFPKNELAKEFLLKVRYREERENFIQSFTIEAPLEIDS